MIYKILQIKDIKSCPYLFDDYKFAKNNGFALEDYSVVYQGQIEAPTHEEALDRLFAQFNINRPTDFHGHSMSVSDIVQINGINYYCDPLGWTALPKQKEVNLAKALQKNRNCWGFIYPVADGLYQYQNDNDLGLDLEPLDHPIYYTKKVFIAGRYYAYLLLQGDEECEDGVTLSLAKLLLQECHKHIIPLTPDQKKVCDSYWSQF